MIAAERSAMQLAGGVLCRPDPEYQLPRPNRARRARLVIWQAKPGLLVSYMPLANSIFAVTTRKDSIGAAGRKAPAGTRIAAAETKQRNHAVDAAVALQSSLSDSRKAYEPASEQTRRAHVRAEA